MARVIGFVRSRTLAASAIRIAILSPIALIPTQVRAQTTLPDPASIEVPQITATISETAVDRDGSAKFYFLRKNGASFKEAYEDFADCYRFLQDGPPLHLPGFAPWTEVARRKESSPNPSELLVPNPSLLGIATKAAIAAVFLPMLEATYARNLANLKLRICMEPRGYQPISISKNLWQQIHRGNVRDAILRQAKLASTAGAGNG